MFGIRPFCQDKVSKHSGGRFHRRGPKSTLNIHAPNSARNCTSAPGAGLAHAVYGTAIGVRPNASPREAGFKTGIRACTVTRRESREHTRIALNGDLPIAVQLINVRADLGHRLARQLGLHFQKVQTPKGEGRLWQVFTVRVGVVLDDSPERVTDFEPDEVRPSPGGQSLPHRPMG